GKRTGPYLAPAPPLSVIVRTSARPPRRQRADAARSLSSNAASPRMNLGVSADDSCLDPHVSCVKTSHPAAQLDVNAEQRSVCQSMMSGPHHGDRAHIHTTFGTSGKFIGASSSSRSGVAYCHQAPPFSVRRSTVRCHSAV